MVYLKKKFPCQIVEIWPELKLDQVKKFELGWFGLARTKKNLNLSRACFGLKMNWDI